MGRGNDMEMDVFLKGIKDGIKGDYYESNNKKVYPEYGDIICKDSGLVYHFGIYADDKRIIHFAPRTKEELTIDNIMKQAEGAEIHAVSLKGFLTGEPEFFVCNCPKIPVLGGLIPDSITALSYKLYTPEETVKRATKLIGKKGYDLFLNNCETFAFWCKTGIDESLQAFNFLKGVRLDRIRI